MEFGDYYTTRAGYVLEDKTFHDETAAINFIVDTWGMTAVEARVYLKKLQHKFFANCEKFKRTLSIQHTQKI